MPVKLQRSTLPAFLDGIDVDKLPPTFQQAIILTKSLGIEYIWIDSLCIIQDDDIDWANECTRMTSVYMNSFINIGANAAGDSRGGLFQQRSWKSVNPLVVPLTHIPSGWHRKPVVLWPSYPIGNLLDHAPLGDRGWVVQERLLASRTVHFLKHKVVWECDECQASETDVTGKLEDFRFSRKTYLAVPVAPGNGRAGRIREFLGTWTNIVSLYSHAKLSVATDKLVALSGVARYMFEHRQDNRAMQYYAGHWSQDFELQLTWRATPFNPGSRSRTYVAPSWSWASYNGKVSFLMPYEETSLAQLISIETFPQSDPFGAVSASSQGYLRFRGPLCRAAVTHLGHWDEVWGSGTLRLLWSGINIECPDLSFDEPDEVVLLEDSAEQQNSFVVFGISQSHFILQGILLQLTGVQRGQYRRIGIFQVDNPFPKDEQSPFVSLLNAFGAMDIPEQYYEQRGNDWYEFMIV
ncbi:hypothetical protein GT037_010708 [Alternaria burnsii]|uniref:Heterokaryon incompatibility domain-containing protein n=1 Tax=Alternaria burnsii TaxID=1187904 RepID=A0A8H7E949_9PLEO|nr:uncharacterized protein GT037_010708 [Alternaria burnsii]KAF7671147.1 hypothetical protein GT037_010708 [Alternaria burnsii]